MPTLTQTRPALSSSERSRSLDQEPRHLLYASHRHPSQTLPATQSFGPTSTRDTEDATVTGTARRSQPHYSDQERAFRSTFEPSRPPSPKRSRGSRPSSSLSVQLASPVQLNAAPFSPPALSHLPPQLVRSNTEPRSLIHRRPPAPHSSFGIETSYGPPPALTIRPSYCSDTIRRVQGSAEYTFAQQQSAQTRLGDSGAKPPHHRRTASSITITEDSSKGGPDTIYSGQSLARRSSPSRSNSRISNVLMEGPHSRNTEDRYSIDHGDGSGSPGEPKDEKNTPMHTRTDEENSADASEDLFLNLAQDSPQRQGAGEGQSVTQRRRVSHTVRM